MSEGERRMGFNATWAMAVGGMVGGGIFSVLGLVVSLAGQWAWGSFVIAGLIALATGYSYVALASKYGEGGGAFTFLREINREGFAGTLSWILIVGYVLTLSVYASTFGHYLGAILEVGPWFDRASAATILLVLIGVNLLGVGEASWLEVVTVWGKLAILGGLAALGLWHFAPDAVRYDEAVPGGITGMLVGAASIFMAYEGFQLLTYDYEDIRDPKKTLRLAVFTAIPTVIVVYVLVALASASLVGSASLVENQEIALASAGEAALGTFGKVVVSIAAAFSTASAINATLFATARLSHHVSEDGELPAFLAHENRAGIPDRAVIVLGVLGLVLALLGRLSQLVEGASLAFLFTFATVNVLNARTTDEVRWISWAGAAGAILAIGTLGVRLASNDPKALAALLLVGLVLVLGRPFLLKRAR